MRRRRHEILGKHDASCLTYENKKTTAAARSKVGWLTGAVLGEINDEPVLLHTKKKFDLFSANFK